MSGGDSQKQLLRRSMRALRRSLPDLDERSEQLWDHVRSVQAVQQASVLMVFDSVPGEPVTGSFIESCRARGQVVVLPEDVDLDASTIDVVIVPGTAFTVDGRRLGQGGGWYDRFLPRVRADCATIGVGFEPQLLDDLPTEPHDVQLQLVVTDAGVAR